jgi:receptor-type tyrosine-protein phosphatase gamma
MNIAFFRKYFKSAYYYVDDAPRMTVPVGAPDWEDGAAPDGKAPGAVAFRDFISHVEKLHADSDIGFAKEYEEVQRLNVRDLKDLHITYEQCSHPDNKAKNRYLNIVACKLRRAFKRIRVKDYSYAPLFRRP